MFDMPNSPRTLRQVRGMPTASKKGPTSSLGTNWLSTSPISSQELDFTENLSNHLRPTTLGRRRQGAPVLDLRARRSSLQDSHSMATTPRLELRSPKASKSPLKSSAATLGSRKLVAASKSPSHSPSSSASSGSSFHIHKQQFLGDNVENNMAIDQLSDSIARVPPITPIADTCLKDSPKNTNFMFQTTSFRSTSNAQTRETSPSLLVRRRSSKFRRRVGLQNLGNTCFMSSVFQCLVSLPDVINILHTSIVSHGTSSSTPTTPSKLGCISPHGGKLARAFASVANDLIELGDHGTSINPRTVKQAIGEVAPRFLGYEQQDAQEFLRFLLAGLHDDLNRIRIMPTYVAIEDNDSDTDAQRSERWWNNFKGRNDSVLVDLFAGQLKSRVECLSCGKISLAFDPFWDLSVPVPDSSATANSSSSQTKKRFYQWRERLQPSVSLSTCFDYFTEAETLTGDEQFYCSICKTHRDVVKQLSIYRFPPILVVHLKRFNYTVYSHSKIETPVKFPVHKLDLSPYATAGSLEQLKQERPTYDLYAVSNHIGSLGGGHYTAFGRLHTAGSDTDDEAKSSSSAMRRNHHWALFNDESTEVVGQSALQGKDAYILFYRRRT